MPMSRINTVPRTAPIFTHEGAPAKTIPALKQLRRSVLSCLLWENEFYESGELIADRIRSLVDQVFAHNPKNLNLIADLAIEARGKFNLRHVPLLLLCKLIEHGRGEAGVGDVINIVIQRADEMGELLAMYWANTKNKHMVPAQLRKGLARAITKFDEYQLAKYDRDGKVKLRDVFRLARPIPANAEQEALWGRAVKRELVTPDTWEVALSGGADKKATFERLITEDNLGYLALLRNLRNMAQAGVDSELVVNAIVARKGAHRVFPFRYVAAARAAPQFEPALDIALREAIAQMQPFSGKTVVLVDVSGSMDWQLSTKSDLKRIDAGAALAAIFPGVHRMFTFSNALVEVAPRRGMAGVDAIVKSQQHGGTYLGRAVTDINTKVPHDRLIVITDEQSADKVPDPIAKHAYMINVASAKNGVGYGKWTHIDGFSEQVIRFIREIEADEDAAAS
jgi:60 kDa SS-A/Ro ribonucleoprotein